MNFDPKLFYRTAFWISFSGLIVFIDDFGFVHTHDTQTYLNHYYYFVLLIGIFSTGIRYFKNRQLVEHKAFVFDISTVLLTLLIFYYNFFSFSSSALHTLFENTYWVKFAVLFTFIREFSEIKLNYRRTFLNPAQLFIASFLLIIIIGSLLLILPKATHYGISYLDALFTSTSAVCVTGLTVVDTGSDFTLFGQTIIMLLIQAGGLGILTFASYFSYFFKGGTTYENQLVFSDMTSSRTLNEVFSTLKYIILITFGIELFSGLLIYTSLGSENFTSISDRIFFSTFHSISAFCNAGFSTLPQNLYEVDFKYNYYMQLIVIFTFVLGGLGFPIVVNLLKYLKYKIKTLFTFSTQKIIYKPWVLNLNSRITLVTTFSISIVAFILFYFLEYNNALIEHSGFGKIVTALFGATTPRTAGFNTIDTASLAFPTLMMIFLLMWIGASPQSTGGGIKTTTFTIATLNILSLAKGKSRIEIFRREISDVSVRRAFAIISLSFIVIGFGIMLISIFDKDKDLLSIAFECFSAYGTVGLSLGITSKLSSASKLVIIIIMFVGRISMLSLVTAVFKKIKHKNYSYPKEELTIN